MLTAQCTAGGEPDLQRRLRWPDGSTGHTWSSDNEYLAEASWPNRRLDYVLVSWPRPDGFGTPTACWLAGTEPVDGVQPSGPSPSSPNCAGRTADRRFVASPDTNGPSSALSPRGGARGPVEGAHAKVRCNRVGRRTGDGVPAGWLRRRAPRRRRRSRVWPSARRPSRAGVAPACSSGASTPTAPSDTSRFGRGGSPLRRRLRDLRRLRRSGTRGRLPREFPTAWPSLGRAA